MSKVLRFAAHFPYVIVIGDEASEGKEISFGYLNFYINIICFCQLLGAYKIECAEMLGFGQ